MQYLPITSLGQPEYIVTGRSVLRVPAKGRQVSASSFLPLSRRTSSANAMVLMLVLLLSNSFQLSVAARQPLQLALGQQVDSTTHTSSSSDGSVRHRRALQQQQPMPPAQTVTQVYLTFDVAPRNATQQEQTSSTQAAAATGATAAAPNSTTASAGAPAAAAASAPPSPPPAEAPWQQRRTLQLPPHVYLISFVMLLAIMAGLLSCHCWRMCRIARRMRQAAELGVTVSAAGAMLSKRTPQSVIESLPVSKYSIIHNRRLAKATPNTGKGTAAGQHAAGNAAAGNGAEGSSNAFVAAAMQIRDQLARQSGIGTFSFGRSNSSGTAAAAASAAAAVQQAGGMTARSSFSNDVREISPALADGSTSNTGGSVQDGAGLPAGAATSLQDSSTAPSAIQAVQDASSIYVSEDDIPAAAAALTPPPVAAGAAAAAAVTVSRAGSGKLVSAGLSSNGAEPCAICFEDFTDNDDVKQLPCNHFYHCSCIDEWLVRDVTCPLCKAPVLDEELLEEQQRIAAALEASFGNVNAALRRQQQAQRERRRARELRNNANNVGLGIAAAAAAVASDTRQDSTTADTADTQQLQEQQHEQQQQQQHPRVLLRRQGGGSTARELLELAGLAMLQMSGRRRPSSGSRSRSSSSTVNSQQQQQGQQQEGQQQQQPAAVPTDVEMGVTTAAAAATAERT